MTIGVDDPEPLLGPLPPGTYVTDPDMGMLAETEYDVVSGGAPTGGPNRYTLHVPYDSTTLSLGKGSTSWIKDDGFTAITDKHVHLHTRTPQTMLLMGGPTQHGWTGPNGANNPGANRGYMVVTEGRAWQEARGHQVLLSKESDAVLRSAGASKRAIVQADQGDVDVLAKSRVFAIAPTVTIVAPAAYAPATEFNDATGWTAELPEVTAGEWQSKVAAWFDVLLSAHDLVKAGAATVKTFKAGESTPETYTTDLPKYLLDAVDFATAFGEASSLWKPEPGAGQFKVAAEAEATMQAGSKVTVWAGSSASFGGGRNTGVGGGLSTSVKAAVWASVGAAYVGVKGLRKVEILSEYGPAAVKAKTTLELISEHGDAKISAKKVGQLVADGGAFVFGKTEFACMSGDGWGIGGNGGLTLGKVTNTTALSGGAGSFDSSNCMKFTDSEISAYRGSAGYALRDNKVSLFSNGKVGELLIEGSQIKVDGARICLG